MCDEVLGRENDQVPLEDPASLDLRASRARFLALPSLSTYSVPGIVTCEATPIEKRSHDFRSQHQYGANS